MSQRSFLKMSAGSVALLAATAACGGGDEEAEDVGSEPLIEFNDPPSVNVDLSGLVPVEAGSVLVFNSQGDQYDDGRTVWVEGSTEGPIVHELTSNTSPYVSPDGAHYVMGTPIGSASPYQVMHVTRGGYTPPRELVGDVFFAAFGGSVDWSRDGRYLTGWGSADVNDGEHIGIYDVFSEREWARIPVRDTGSLRGTVGGMIEYAGGRDNDERSFVALSDAGITEPIVQTEELKYKRAEDGSLWRIDESSGEIARAVRFGAAFEEIASISDAEHMLAIPDGSGAYVQTNSGVVYFVSRDGGAPAELLRGVSHFGFEVYNSGIFPIMEDGRRFYLDRQGSVQLDPDATGVLRVRDAHVSGTTEAGDWYLTGFGGGGAAQVAVLPPGANVSCHYDQEFGPATKLALPYSLDGSRHIAFIDISSHEAQLISTFDASAENSLSCPIFSLDGNSVAFVEATETGGTVWKVDWTSAPAAPQAIFTSETYVKIVAMN